MKIKKLIIDEITKFLKEDVRVSNPKNWGVYSKEEPYKLTDKIKVYHGFYSKQAALIVAKFGLSGLERAKRVYSYETYNNPYGLFVTTNFEAAKRFAYSGIIMEFNAMYKDLEAPTWKGDGGYFVQGQFADTFKSKKERDLSILKSRARAKKDKDTRISKSDNPETAYWLFGAENQALFTGHLNPNMIKYFWVKKRGERTYEKYKPKEFLKEFFSEDLFFKNGYNSDYISNKDKIFKPNDDLNLNYWRENLEPYNYYCNKKIYNHIINNLKNKEYDRCTKEIINITLYPKQKLQLKKMFDVPDDILNFKYYHR